MSSFDTFVAERSALSLSWFFMAPPIRLELISVSR